jgi:hypothetical protein
VTDERPRKRLQSQADGVPSPVDFEPATGVVDGPELKAVRERRPTDVRIAHLEGRLDAVQAEAKAGDAATNAKLDALKDDVYETKAAIGELGGQLNGQDRVLEIIARDVKHISEREQITITALGTAKVRIEEAKQIAGVNEASDVKKARRARTTAAIVAITGAAGTGVGFFIHWLAGRL